MLIQHRIDELVECCVDVATKQESKIDALTSRASEAPTNNMCLLLFCLFNASKSLLGYVNLVPSIIIKSLEGMMISSDLAIAAIYSLIAATIEMGPRRLAFSQEEPE